MSQVLLLELNELNLELVEAYGDALPEFQRLIRTHGVAETTSEARYDQWEPWIQWVTAHTGLTLAEHGVFRLGDIVRSQPDQVWEELERSGLRVGAISPMNAANLLSNPAFFLPDPWTKTKSSAPWLLKQVHAAIVDAVEGNAEGKLSPIAALWIALGLGLNAQPRNYGQYLKLAWRSLGRHWSRAVLLDVLLGDIFIRLLRRTKPDFASVFLNAGAHIQHHYMFSAAVYQGKERNPAWYVAKGADPLFEVLSAYDRIIGQLRSAFPQARLMIATGLHQIPHKQLTYYWRLRKHSEFLKTSGLVFDRVEPRMSRDFVVFHHTEQEARLAESVLASAHADDGEPLFRVDNRGRDLFVELVYSKDVSEDAGWSIGERRFANLRQQVAFVAIKNGEHDGVGYLIDTGADFRERTRFPLTDLRRRVVEACGAAPQTFDAVAAE